VTFDANALANAATRKLGAYDPGHDLPALRKRFGSALAELGSNENPLGPSPRALAALQAALPEVLRYPDPKGGALKSALAARLGVAAEQITLGNGSHELLMLIAQCFADASASIVFSEFGFAVFPIATAASGAQALRVPALPRDHATMPLGHDLDAMATAVRADTRVLYVANPNNPTGTWFDDEALERLLAQVPASTLVVVDEPTTSMSMQPACPAPCNFCRVSRISSSRAHVLEGLCAGRPARGLCDQCAEVAAVLERLRESFNVNGSRSPRPKRARRSGACRARESMDICRARVACRPPARTRTARAAVADEFRLVDFARDATPIESALFQRGVIARPMGGTD
jgi:histidinol-phosphate aminotransferase